MSTRRIWNITLKPVADLIRETLLNPKSGVIHADETSLTVIRTDGGKKECRMFVLTSNKWEEEQASVYEFRVSRSADTIISMLSDFSGTVLCDDYPGYDTLARESLGQVKLARCWFHWRKRLEEVALLAEKAALGSCGKQGLEEEQRKRIALAAREKSYAGSVLKEMGRIFDIESEFYGKTAEELLDARKNRTRPIVENLFARLRKERPNMGQPLADAVDYGLRIEDELKEFLDNPYIEMTNNRCERAVKDFVVARKNFLFSYSAEGAEAAGIIMTVIRTARLNRLDPERYIDFLLGSFSTAEKSRKAMADLKALLPWSGTLPESLRSDTKKLPSDLESIIKAAANN